MIISPPTPAIPSIAVIHYSAARVTVRLPEKHEPFRLLMHRLDYQWTGTTWAREMDKYSGQAIDRAAELGRLLIQAGYIVDFPDDTTRDMAINQTYAPECRKWIRARIAGDYAGWFNIWWRKGEDLYREAMRLSGARYNPPGVVVPSERYEEVLDFAEINGCQLSDGARELVEKARTRMNGAVVFDLKDKPTTPKASEPDHYEVADGLRDEPL